MDITKLNPVAISTYAKDKVICDFFPDVVSDDDKENAEELDSRNATMHAGAFCLYATMLMTKVYEENPFALEPYYSEREQAIRQQIENDSQYDNMTEEQINSIIKNRISTDIRNSFAHGNFKISYDIYTKKLNFVLTPIQHEFNVSEPIVISSKSILKTIKKQLETVGDFYALNLRFNSDSMVTTGLSTTLKKFLLPAQTKKITEYYLNSGVQNKNSVLFKKNSHWFIYYVLMATKITYEQQDYYNIFGKDSNIFETIRLIRNSLAHDGITFTDDAENIHYKDKRVELNESVVESVSKLLIVDAQKQTIMMLYKSNCKPEIIQSLIDDYKNVFDQTLNGMYRFEDMFDENDLEPGQNK
ncbi:MAG: hypothetical protein IJ542_01885 [Clostridia bacterium]|nr:hypothetical protein [Clostridia bacterium]